MIDDIIVSDKLEEMIKRYIEKHFERLFEEACIKALTHKANKEAFTQIKNGD